MIPHLLMSLGTIIGISYILYNFIIEKPIINVFFAVLFQSIFLFLIRFFWLHHSFGNAFLHSFDLLTIIIAIIYIVYKLNDDTSKD